MMMAMKQLFATAATMVLVLACSAPAQQTVPAQAAPAQGSSEVAVRIGDRAVTIAELDEQWRRSNPSGHAQAAQSVYDGRRATIDAMVANSLLEQAAKAKGVTVDQYTSDEMSRRATPVTQTDVTSFYDANKERLQGRSLESIGPSIKQYLEEQRTTAAREALLAELRKAAPPVRITLEPPRQQVAVNEDDPAEGNATAPITVIEFSDFQCPFCAQAAPTLSRIRAAYGDQIRFVWKDLPLTAIHPQALKAAEAGWCAGEQGKFWNLHDHLFANREALDTDDLKRYAAELKLDTTRFNACLDSSKYESRVRQSISIASSLGITSTPTTFVNGRMITGAQPYAAFASIIDEELERVGAKK
jgi:protein-disulfide isomerase